MVWALGFGVEGLGFGVWGLGFRVWGVFLYPFPIPTGEKRGSTAKPRELDHGVGHFQVGCYRYRSLVEGLSTL